MTDSYIAPWLADGDWAAYKQGTGGMPPYALAGSGKGRNSMMPAYPIMLD